MTGFSDTAQARYGRPTVPTHLSKAEFCRWVDRQDGKYEWKDGRVVQMNFATKAHARLVANIMFALRQRLDPDLWAVTSDDPGVEDEDFIRFPDVIVEPMDTDDKSRRSSHPVILVEVLSPSSAGRDFLEKREEYSRFPSLRAYLIASQDAPIVWLWTRGADGAFADKPEEFSGRETIVPLPHPALELPLGEVYRGIAVAQDG